LNILKIEYSNPFISSIHNYNEIFTSRKKYDHLIVLKSKKGLYDHLIVLKSKPNIAVKEEIRAAWGSFRKEKKGFLFNNIWSWWL
jgi:hypothetical protein